MVEGVVEVGDCCVEVEDVCECLCIEDGGEFGVGVDELVEVMFFVLCVYCVLLYELVCVGVFGVCFDECE